jgi:hypothetical protein
VEGGNEEEIKRREVGRWKVERRGGGRKKEGQKKGF